MDALTPDTWKAMLPKDEVKNIERVLDLPERVLQFGTGVLLRALPDYFIDLANKAGRFNGRVVVVKSTPQGDLRAFRLQHCLYTHLIRGFADGKLVEQSIINASISRVLSAQQEWQEVMKCAENPDMQLIVSNTTEAGLILEREDIFEGVPRSFPAKLLAWLFHRFNYFNGDKAKGMVIVPTELIPHNGEVLKQLLLELSAHHSLPADFQSWLTERNHFCTSLVDRIVPGKLPIHEQETMEQKMGFRDALMIASEPYALWAIKVNNEKAKEILDFSNLHRGVILAPDISEYVALKLRLLNGSHTFNCGLAVLAGIRTVREAMEDDLLRSFMKKLLLEELVPSISGGDISLQKARDFALNTMERFQNPFIEHPWINITLQYTSKMKIRNIPTLQKSISLFGIIPPCMVIGFAAYLLFMKGETDANGNYTGTGSSGAYPIKDDKAQLFSELWEKHGAGHIVEAVCKTRELWDFDLSSIPGFIQQVNLKLQQLMEQGVRKTLAHSMNDTIRP